MKIEPAYTLQQLAALIDADYVGDPDQLIKGLNEIHMVVPGDITFVDHPKYYDKALNSAATTIIINKRLEPPKGKAIIISDDPFVDFNKLIIHFRSFEPSTKNISPSAEIGKGTIIQPGVFIGNHVKVGNNCVIHPNVSIYDHCIVGDNVIIHANSVIGADAFYFQKREGKTLKFNSCGRVIIENNVEIGACCTIDKGVTGDTQIGEYTKLDNHIQVGHDTVIGKYCLFASHCAIAGVTRIEDNVILWGNVIVNKDIVIGENAVIYANSGVSKSIPGNKVYYGAPVREASVAMREMAMVRMLPELFRKLNKPEK
jgi:UDP-3-O-[3-hydroxymyristoyl] glucosamine N-acyltransferase